MLQHCRWNDTCRKTIKATGQFAKTILDRILTTCQGFMRVDIVFDVYIEHSIISLERSRRSFILYKDH